jgi:hypothetical protein
VHASPQVRGSCTARRDCGSTRGGGRVGGVGSQRLHQRQGAVEIDGQLRLPHAVLARDLAPGLAHIGCAAQRAPAAASIDGARCAGDQGCCGWSTSQIQCERTPRPHPHNRSLPSSPVQTGEDLPQCVWGKRRTISHVGTSTVVFRATPASFTLCWSPVALPNQRNTLVASFVISFRTSGTHLSARLMYTFDWRQPGVVRARR